MSQPTPSAGSLQVDGRSLDIREGDTLAACLMRAGLLAVRQSLTGELRGLYCGMGVCNECLLTVDGVRNVRACVTPARPGSLVLTGIAPQ